MIAPRVRLAGVVEPIRFRRISPDALDYALFLPGICLAGATGIALRLIGPLIIVIPIGTCLLYAVIRQTKPPLLLGVYLCFCFFIALLSEFRLMPNSWQLYFFNEAIVRQLIPTIAFFCIAWASKAYFKRRLLNGDIFLGFKIIVPLCLIVSPLMMLAQGMRYQDEDPSHTMLDLYGAFINNVIIAMFFVTGRIFLAKDWRRYAGLGFVLAVAATSHFMQFKILTAIAVVSLLGAPGRLAVIGAVAGLIASYAIGTGRIPETMLVSPNSGIRLVFISDVLTSARDTHGFGIGFGKESVHWRYHFPNMPDFTFLPDPNTMTHERMLQALSTGVHNSFVQSLLRTGVIGFALLVAAFAAVFPPKVGLSAAVRNHAAVMFALITIACFVNPALESPVQVVGVGFVYGYLSALRINARKRSTPTPVRVHISPLGGPFVRQLAAPSGGSST